MSRTPADHLMYAGDCGTHVPLLASAMITSTSGDVLELGAGWWSTLTMHAICEAQGCRRLVTADSDAQWLSKLEFLRTPWHEFVHVENWKDWDGLDQEWGIAFIDQYPQADRGLTIFRLAHKANILVVHDTEDMVSYGYEGMIDKFKYRHDHKVVEPYTTVLSMFRKFSFAELPEKVGYTEKQADINHVETPVTNEVAAAAEDESSQNAYVVKESENS